MKLYLLLFICTLLLTSLSIAQKDSIMTIFLERVNKKDKTIIKKVVPWKPFYIQKKNEHDKLKVITLNEVLDSSLVITRQHQKEIIIDTIPLNMIMYINARTKGYNVRRMFGVLSTTASGIGSSSCLFFAILPYQSLDSRVAALTVMFAGGGSIVASKQLIKMRRFNITTKWTIKSGYY